VNLKLTNSTTEYDLSKWTVDFSGIRFRNSYNDRFGQPGQEKQGDGKESARSIVFSYAIDGESDSEYITDTDTLYAAVRSDLQPFYIVDQDNDRRLRVSINELEMNPKPGTELRFSTARLNFTALDTFWEKLTPEVVDPGTAGVENQDEVTCTNPGVVTVYPVITIEPTESNLNFTLINDTTDDVFTFSSSSFVPGSVLEIDCQNGTVYLTNVNTVTEVSSAIADGTNFLHLVPGVNVIRYESAYGAVTMEVSFRRRWPF